MTAISTVLDECKVTRPVVRYHGSKFRLASWVMSFFPPHRIYVEPFGGAAGVLIQKPRAYSEVYNDIDGDVVNLFRVIRDPAQCAHLIHDLVTTPYARAEFDLAWESHPDPVEQARRLVIRAMMGFGSAGATKGSTGFRIDTKREYETAQHTWMLYPDNLARVCRRLSGVLIENRPAVDVMVAHDTPETLFFVDPPYVHATRTRMAVGGVSRAYRHELSDIDHAALLDAVSGLRGMVVLSGYPTEIYDEMLPGWARRSTRSRISGGRGTKVREEVVWINPACWSALNHVGGLFE